MTFDPRSPGAPAASAVDPGGALTAVACPSSSRCVAGDGSGRAVTFDPAAPAAATTTSLGSAPVADVACASPSACAAVDTHGGATSLNPDTGTGIAATIDPGRAPVALACAAAARCTAVDGAGLEVTFDPSAAAAPSSALLAAANPLSALSCPTASQCTALDTAGGAVTFDPGATNEGSRAQLPRGADGTSPDAIACPTVSLCVAIRARDAPDLLVFDPRSPGAAALATIAGPNALVGLACPAATACVVTETSGDAITLDPLSASGGTVAVLEPTDRSLGPVACPSATSCTAIAYRAGAVSFSPGTASGARQLPTVDPSGATLTALACPAIGQCTALDGGGDEVTFDPRSTATGRAIAIGAARSLAGLACPRVSFCVAVDTAGNAITGDPEAGARWTATAIPGAAALNALACPTVIECVAVDAAGQEVTGAAPPPPPPALAGIGQAHSRWRDRGRRAARRPPLGTTFTARISEAAKLTVTITTRVAGRPGPAGLCLRTSARAPRARCLRTTTVGVLSASVPRGGSAKLPFSGRVPGGRLLPPGRYTASIFATDVYGSSSRPRSLTFTIVG